MYSDIFIFMTFVFFAYYNDADLTAGFGFGNSLYQFFWQALVMVNSECSGIIIAKNYGSGDFKGMRLNFQRSCFMNSIITAIAFIIYLNLHRILAPLEFDPNLIRISQEMVVGIIPALCLQSTTEALKSYAISIRIYKPFTYLNLLAYISTLIGGWIFIYE